ncbi:MAG TPA: hypothetical protein P5234_13415 [Thermoanaerobaculaceae bacterium]|nr:hypothetical protein [Thermoanaerobaculaceae bacterium]HRS17232.1 hypothetical protein [Thermoanaerobaculaceae bacterium]
MTCEELRALLDTEGEASSPAARAHLEGCRACSREVERWRLAQAALRELGREPAPPFLHARIMAHVRAEAPGSRPAAWLRGWRAPALAAVGAAVVILGLGLYRAVTPPPVTPVAEVADSREKAAAPEPASGFDKGAAGPPAPAAVVADRVATAARRQEAADGTPPAAEEKHVLAAAAAVPTAGIAAAAGEPARDELGAAAPAATEAMAPRASADLAGPAPGVAGETRGGAPAVGTLRAAERQVAGVVRCRLQLEGGGDVVEVDLPAEGAPLPEEVWSVTFSPDGRIEVLDAFGRTRQAPALLQQGLSQTQRQQLRLGRYRLSQAPVPATPAP